MGPKNFLNDPEDAVSELIEGLLLQYPNQMQKLENHNVLLSSSIDYDKVNVISGGGSGHEPSHAGWIGQGMLTGAVLGGIFASPSVSSILAAIRAVSQPKSRGGCLLVVKNYTGDRLNFAMACELANAEGRRCRMVVVADDCALERTKGITGARGVAGTVFVHKVAGAAAAANNMSLDEVATLAQTVADRVGTLGVALDAVTIPGSSSINDRLDSQTIEIGLGIHGEAGIRQSPLLTANELANIMVTTIRDFGRPTDTHDNDNKDDIVPTFREGDDLAVLVNNLGGTSNFEMSILANSVVKLLEGNDMKCTVSRLYVGSFMTSFEMHGASVSILSLSDGLPNGIIQLLDDSTTAPAWIPADIWKKDNNEPRPSSKEVKEVIHTTQQETPEFLLSTSSKVMIDNFEEIVKEAIKAASQALIDAEPTLTKYDTIVGDGDCGLTMKRGGTEILSRLNGGILDCTHPVTLFSNLADAVSASMGGTSGILIELMFRKISTYLLQLGEEQLDITPSVMVNAFQEGVKAVSLYGGATVGARTMLDALFPACDALLSSTNMEDAAKAADIGAKGTAQMMTASAGRSNYLSKDVLEGTPDPGAVAVSIVLKAISDITNNTM